MQNQWFSDKAEEIEVYSSSNNSKEFYKSLQAVYGRQSSSGSPPLLDAKGEHLLTDKEKILERWGEHFENVLNRPSSINLEAIERLPQIDTNADLDLLPTLDEVSKAISSLSNGKAPGSDAIPAEIYASGGPSLVEELLGLYVEMWKQEVLPQEFKDAAITHLICTKTRKTDRYAITTEAFPY